MDQNLFISRSENWKFRLANCFKKCHLRQITVWDRIQIFEINWMLSIDCTFRSSIHHQLMKSEFGCKLNFGLVLLIPIIMNQYLIFVSLFLYLKIFELLDFTSLDLWIFGSRIFGSRIFGSRIFELSVNTTGNTKC